MIRTVIFFSLLLSAFFGSGVCDDPPRQFGPLNNGIDFLGHSGQIVLWTIDGAHWVKIKFLKLQEIDAAGNVVAQVNHFDNDDFTWQVKGPGVNWGTSFIEVMLQANEVQVNPMGGGNNPFTINFQIDTFIFKQALNMTFAGEVVQAKAGQLKWQLMVNNWKFQNTANKLRFGVNLLSDSFANNTAYNQLNHVPATVSSFAIAFGKAELIIPRVALIDGKAANITATVLYEAGQLAVQWDYPSFTTSLVYDPVAATTDLIVSTSAAHTNYAANGLVILLAALATMWIMLTK